MGVPKESTIKRLFALSGNNCAYPGCEIPIIEGSGTITGEICHIRAKNPGGPRYDAEQPDSEAHEFDNLILLCRHHHRVIDSEPDIYSVDALSEMKAAHEGSAGRTEKVEDLFFAKILINDSRKISVENNSGNIAIDSPGTIQATSLSIKATREKISVSSPPGTIGADRRASQYVQYLINRYNKFAASEPSRRTKFSYGAISRNIESKFGSQWKLISIEASNDLFSYIQGRIDMTRQAKINRGKGHRSYSSFEEFIDK